VALVDLLATWDIKPSAVVGHSSGEIAAAYAAGALTKKEAIIAAFYRGYVCTQSRVAGGMAAVGLGRDEVIPYLASGVRVACENSGSSVTLSGDLDRLEGIMDAIKKDFPNILVRRLQVEMAYHSRGQSALPTARIGLLTKKQITCRRLETPTVASSINI
jgi:acyl transferase domain-containing protein